MINPELLMDISSTFVFLRYVVGFKKNPLKALKKTLYIEYVTFKNKTLSFFKSETSMYILVIPEIIDHLI